MAIAILEADDEYLQSEEALADPMEGHKCEKISEARMGPKREEWIGKLLEPIPDHEKETHCWHIKTPYKTVVFGIIPEDLYVAAVFAQELHGKPLNPRWLDRMVINYHNIASKHKEVEADDGT